MTADFSQPIIQFPHGALLALSVLFLSIAVPMFGWFIFLCHQYPPNGRPKKLMQWSFMLGIISAIVGIGLEGRFFKTISLVDITHFTASTPFIAMLLSAFLVGLMEEFLKFIALYVGLYRAKNFTRIVDGVVFACSVALGASFIENIFFFTFLSVGYPAKTFLLVMFVRGLFTTTAHVVSTGILGYYLAKAKFTHSSKVWLMLQGLLYAATLHGTLDFLLTVVPPPFGSVCAAAVDVAALIFFVKLCGRARE